MYPNHYIEGRLFSTFSRQLAKESNMYTVFFYVRLFLDVSRTEADNGPIVYPQIADGLICSNVE
jgi:hypothetical protein